MPRSGCARQNRDTTIAETLVKLGTLRRKHWQGSVSKACVAALKEWLPPIKANLTLCFTDDCEAALQVGIQDAVRQRFPDRSEPKEGIGGLYFIVGEASWHFIGPALERFEAAHPRLGQTILSVLTAGLWRLGGCWGPSETESACEYQHWMGEHDERMTAYEYIDGCGKDTRGKTAEEIDRMVAEAVREMNIPTRAMLDASAPEWAFAPSPLVEVPASVSPPDPAGNRVLALTRELLALLKRTKHFVSDHHNFEEWSPLAVPYFLRWNTDDLTVRLTDDEYACEQNSGGLMDLGRTVLFDMNQPETIAEAFRSLPAQMKIFAKAEQLLELIGEPEDRRS